MVLLKKRLEPTREWGDKAARDVDLRTDLLDAANEYEQVKEKAVLILSVIV